MTVKQISIFLENKAGKLTEVAAALSEGGVNLRAMSLAEAQEFGIVRVIVDDYEKAKEVLKEAGLVYSVKRVLAIELEDEAGSLTKVLKALSDKDVNLEYMYAFTTTVQGKAQLILKTSDREAAVNALTESGVQMLGQEDLKIEE